VEHHLNHPLLRDNAQLIIPPTGNRENFAQIVRGLFDVTTPVVMYGLSSEILSNEVSLQLNFHGGTSNYNLLQLFFFNLQDIFQLQTIRSILPTLPIFFVNMPSCEDSSGLTEVDRNEIMNHGVLNFTAEHALSNQNHSLSSNTPSNSFESDTESRRRSSSPILEQLTSLGGY